ncbi:MacB family efflux pump subunit [Rouxiella silvae]|uniref:MacB family efflux pump subunit n=1 Tax=Rouxiella silvae TaxID=1646373 RepID=A0AA41BWJ9_9GAMM|nr:MacB family efflux pump subunit [Rouxiella silvae]
MITTQSSPPSQQPLLYLHNICRHFSTGAEEITVLNNISLSIKAGEMVAIVGPSGSGKSTLMNVIGCLDTPTSGVYQVAGQNVQRLSSDDRALLRRQRFGFIFQRYHLIPALTVLENVEVPARYAHQTRMQRQNKARELLAQLGLGEFETRNVARLSGGQQQRVGIARALVNGGEVILADEPTGALDSRHGREVMQLLQHLHRQGHTVIIITHDPQVADYADRIITLSDGKIVSDVQHTLPDREVRLSSTPLFVKSCLAAQPSWRSRWEASCDLLWSACRTLLAHRMRSGLTLLGIVIGIVSVVSLNAAGEGAKKYVLNTLSTLGANVITLYPGKGFGDNPSSNLRALGRRDLKLLSEQRWITAVAPKVSSTLPIRWRRTDTSANVNGVSAEFLKTNNLVPVIGRSLISLDVTKQSSVVVIDENLQRKLFPAGTQPLGQIILVGTLPCRVVGVMRSTSAYAGNALNLWLPWSTANSRLLGQDWFDSLSVSLNEHVSSDAAKRSIQKLLTRLHGRQDFFMQDSAAFVSSIEKTSFALTLFLSIIALISLLVGGIGVMNIMLVSVSERTRETGVRMAVGARQQDIQRQFLTEAVLLCLAGAAVGVAVSLAIGTLLSLFIHPWKLVFSPSAILTAVGCAVLVGVLSGWLPAWKAARLDPAEALARE